MKTKKIRSPGLIIIALVTGTGRRQKNLKGRNLLRGENFLKVNLSTETGIMHARLADILHLCYVIVTHIAIFFHWEDGGQDDPWAHYDIGGPNSISLNQNRINFAETITTYSAEELEEMEENYKKSLLESRKNNIDVHFKR